MFEFESKEQREAWRVIEQLANSHPLRETNWVETSVQFSEAAARFDKREETCGIQPLSEEHFSLGVIEKRSGLGYKEFWIIGGKKLVDKWLITPEGRKVLERLNAMCKVTA